MSLPIYWLDDDPALFPHPSQALTEPNGLLAAGGDLSPQRLLNAYSLGIFPWYNEDEPILWWSPSPRCVIRPSEFTPSKSLAKLIRKNKFEVTLDSDFEQVITHCATARTEGTWINQDMINAYCRLHELGFAHSIECRLNGDLVGGLYGIALGGTFFGESMFSTVSNSSKIAFSFLCEKLTHWGFTLIDCQVHSDHLESLGAYEIPQESFLSNLHDSIAIKTKPEWLHD
jgi:leucyl/phenylalanyl-tRNA--protein transferase